MMGGTVIASLGGFLYWKFVTLIFETSEVGRAAVALSSANFLASFANLGLTIGLVRFIPNSPPPIKGTLITCAYLLSGCFSIIVALIFLGGRALWAAGLDPGQNLLTFTLIFVALVLALAQMNVYAATLQAERRTPLLFLRGISLIFVQLIAIFILPRNLGAVSIIGTFLVANVVILVIVLLMIPIISMTPRITLQFRATPLRSMLSYSLGNQVFNQLWALPAFLLPLFTLKLLGSSANAYLAVAWLITNFLAIIPNSISVALLIQGSHVEESLVSKARLALITDLILLVPLALIIIAFAPFILSIFGPDYAREASGLLRMMSLASIPACVTSIFITTKQVNKEIASLNLLMFSLSGLIVVSGSIILSKFGLIGIGYALFLSHGIFAIFVTARLWRNNPQRAH